MDNTIMAPRRYEFTREDAIRGGRASGQRRREAARLRAAQQFESALYIAWVLDQHAGQIARRFDRLTG